MFDALEKLEKLNRRVEELHEKLDEILPRVESQDELITIAQAVKRYGRSRSTFSRYISDGKIERFEGGGKYKSLVSTQQLDKLKKQGVL